MFSSTTKRGIPVTAVGDIAGATGGFGWIIEFNKTSPRSLDFTNLEVLPTSPLLISIKYPQGTTFVITAKSDTDYCGEYDPFKCNIQLQKVSTLDNVRNSKGDTYFVDNDGVLTFRLVQTAIDYVGNPNFVQPDYTTPPRNYSRDFDFALQRFTRSGLTLPIHHGNSMYHIQAKCPGDTSTSPKNGYCPEKIDSRYDPDVCPSGYKQIAYDKCCQTSALSKCIYADGTKTF